MDRGSFYGERSVPMIVEGPEVLSIDTPEDWDLAESRLEDAPGS